jgi:hypothetical protein
MASRAKNLALDILIFAEMLVYWPFALLIMKPAQWFDRRFGTRLFRGLDRAVRRIADL